MRQNLLRNPSILVAYAAFLFSCALPGHAFDTLRLNEESKLFNVFDQSVSIVSAKYVGWGKGWDWARVDIRPDKDAKKAKSDTFRYVGEIRRLDVSFSNTVKTEKNRLVWNYDWQKKANHPDATGVGIEFSLNLNSPTFNKAPQPAPELLPDNEGWRWALADGQKIEVKFSPAAANVFFERNQKNKIRALIFTAINSGAQQTTMSVWVGGKKVAVAGPVSLNYDRQDNLETWPQDILSETASPIDLSGLNDKPAGKHGLLRAKGEDLVFADGTPAKFWGGNLQAYALFATSDVDIKAQAKRIAQLGFNLMRIHHHDSSWVHPNIFQDDKNSTQHLSEASLKKLDWWIKCLKEEGVYVWLDLHVGRTFTKNDGIEAFQEIAKDKPRAEVKGYSYLNESIQKSMQRFNEAYLNHVNSFTGLAYKNDPAIAMLLITNENDLTHHFGTLMLPEKKVPFHTGLLRADLQRFAAQTGLPERSLWQFWGPGSPKLFLNDVEHRFNEKMLSHLKEVGAKALTIPTNTWANMSLYSLPSLTDGDLIDVHSYGGAEELNFNPRFKANYLAWIGAAQVTGKPLSVTEWNASSFPVADRFTMPLHLAGIAAFQGWDALMVYGYSQNKLSGSNNKVGNFSIYNDPAIAGMMPAAALLYRQNQVSLGKSYYQIKFNSDNFYNKKIDPGTSKLLRTLLETNRFSITLPENKNLPWLKNNLISARENSQSLDDLDKDIIPPGQDFVESDTRELKRDWEKGIQTIDTPAAQVASGWLGGKNISLSQTSFNIKTKKAIVAVQSIDNKSLKQSRHILVTAMARAVPSKDQLHYQSEPVSGNIAIKAAPRLSIYSIDKFGKRDKRIKASFSKGKYEIELGENNQTHWYLLTDD